VTSGRYRSNKAELDHRSVCRKTGVSPEVEMDVVTRVELEYSYGARDGWTRSRVASMPKERSGGPRLDQSCDWEKYGYDTLFEEAQNSLTILWDEYGIVGDLVVSSRSLPWCDH